MIAATVAMVVVACLFVVFGVFNLAGDGDCDGSCHGCGRECERRVERGTR